LYRACRDALQLGIVTPTMHMADGTHPLQQLPFIMRQEPVFPVILDDPPTLAALARCPWFPIAQSGEDTMQEAAQWAEVAGDHTWLRDFGFRGLVPRQLHTWLREQGVSAATSAALMHACSESSLVAAKKLWCGYNESDGWR
jgi:hypothetical protein